MKRSPIRRSNPERKAKRFERDFGALAVFVRARGCAVCELYFSRQTTPTQACHIYSRGAGNHAWLDTGHGNLLPMCHEHHACQHQHGWAEMLYPAREDREWAEGVAQSIGEEFLTAGGERY